MHPRIKEIMQILCRYARHEAPAPDAFASVNLIAKQAAIIGRGKEGGAQQTIRQAFLGWNQPDDENPAEWPSQSDLAPRLDVTRQRIGQVVTEGRERWKRFPSITALRNTIHELVRSEGGLLTQDELVANILSVWGFAFDEPQRTQKASVATRAAIETERGMQESRFLESRSGNKIFFAISPELKSFAADLRTIADQLAAQDPIPSPASVLEALRRVKASTLPADVAEPTVQRLCQLAVPASEKAALCKSTRSDWPRRGR